MSSEWIQDTTDIDDVTVMQQIKTVFALQSDTTDLRELALAYSPTTMVATYYGEGVNAVHYVQLDTGQDGYFKPFLGLDDDSSWFYGHTSPQQPIHEVAAWRLAKQLGPPWSQMVPPTVLREVDQQTGSMSLHVPGEPQMDVRRVPGWQEAAFYDSLLGQQDRHPSNALVDESAERTYLIDHGFAFPELPEDAITRGNQSCYQKERLTSGVAQLSDHERNALLSMRENYAASGLDQLLERSRSDALLQRIEEMLGTDRITRLKFIP